MSEYSKAVMADVQAKGEGYTAIPSDDLRRVLITGDGRGVVAKQIALDILISRQHTYILDHTRRCPKCEGEGVDGGQDLNECGRCNGKGVVIE